MNLMLQIQAATLAARKRTGDRRIGTKACNGRLQLVRVTFDAQGAGTEQPLSDPLPIPNAIKALDALQ